ncbi:MULTISPECIES: hypothetical protein [Paraburkholderia]|uniref:hypothetical protein n=1 Tax=Paraburkholderia TaxID=1822464 RepID=UPI000376DCCA|nr:MULTISPECIES: hypothetical protein [Paraburkholderia]MDH6149865.1 hypothetical protein [Paraburkholderia sp. WSM4179]
MSVAVYVKPKTKAKRVLAGSTLAHAGANGNADEVSAVRQARERIAVNNRQRAAAAVESVRYTGWFSNSRSG